MSLQDVDCLYLTKEELEVRVGLLRQQLEFLKCIYAEVRARSFAAADSTQGKVSFLKILQVHPKKSVSLYVFGSNAVTHALGRHRVDLVVS